MDKINLNLSTIELQKSVLMEYSEDRSPEERYSDEEMLKLALGAFINTGNYYMAKVVCERLDAEISQGQIIDLANNALKNNDPVGAIDAVCELPEPHRTEALKQIITTETCNLSIISEALLMMDRDTLRHYGLEYYQPNRYS